MADEFRAQPRKTPTLRVNITWFITEGRMRPHRHRMTDVYVRESTTASARRRQDQGDRKP